MNRPLARLCAALILMSVVLSAAPASAHVGVSSPDATAGGFGKLVFRVPTESPEASTTRIRVTLPESTPFAFVSAQPKPGWAVAIEEEDLAEPITVGETTLTTAARTVTWTATGDGIAPGEFDEFALSAGPFPESDQLSFPAEQTYDDGETVRWDEPTTAGGEEPEHPAPTLELSSAEAESASASASDDSPADSVARVLSGVALVAALVTLVVVLRQNRRRA